MASSRAVPVGDARLRAHYLADPARPKTVAFLNTIQPIESVHAELHHSVIAAEPQQRIRTFNTREYVYYIYAKKHDLSDDVFSEFKRQLTVTALDQICECGRHLQLEDIVIRVNEAFSIDKDQKFLPQGLCHAIFRQAIWI